MNFIQRDEYALFPCKCDPIHVGHIVQIKRLLKTHKYVIIDIYDYDSRVMPVEEVEEVINEVMCGCEMKRIRFRTHKTSYAKSSYEAIYIYHIVTGNKAVYNKLKKEGFDVELAYNGVEGMEKVQANPPDAIVLDVMMPEKDGYEMCKELKADSDLCEIPVLLLTAVASHVTSTRYSHADGMSTEADDYIAKPASAEEISQSIRSMLGM